MIDCIPRIFSEKQIHDPAQYHLEYLTDFPSVKQLFSNWIRNGNIIPMAILPIWAYLNDTEEEKTEYYNRIENYIGKNNLNRAFEECAEHKSDYELFIQRKWDSSINEIKLLEIIDYGNLEKMDEYGDWIIDDYVLSMVLLQKS